MENLPLVSVIIPFFKAGNWLTEAVESVLAQTYPNVEILLIDDGSTEEDTAIAKQYAAHYPEKIFYLQHEGHVNKGLPATRNAGIANARGSLVAFLDADDKWMPQKLEKQVALLQRFPQVQMLCEASCFWYSWQPNVSNENGIVFIGAPQGLYQPPQLMSLLYPLGEGQPPCPSGIIITKEALLRCGGFEEGFSGVYQLYEDQAFLSKIYANEIVYISAEANNYYRKRPDSMSSAAKDASLYNKVRIFYANWLQHCLSRSSADAATKNLVENFKEKLRQEALGMTP